MTTENKLLQLETEIVQVLRSIYDPEIPVNIYDLGLIYDIELDDRNNATVTMTLTSPNCPVAESLPRDVKESVAGISGVNSAVVVLVFDPPWDQSMLSDEAKLELGML